MARSTEYKEEYRDLTAYIAERKEKGLIPTVCGYAVYLKYSEQTLLNWQKEQPEFRDAIEQLLALQKDMLITGGLSKDYDSNITRLMLSHNHRVREKTDLNIGGQKDNPLNVVMFGNFTDDDTE